uniref:F-box domain-containing protein n=1 Tax=Panagrolaimus sp. ES5 TaxID=591445 RepID=A0AC34GQ01_9BILA
MIHKHNNFTNLNRKSDEQYEFKKYKSIKKSTLSLHIAAYENSVEADADDSNDEEKEGLKSKVEKPELKCGISKHLFADSSLKVQNPFEFPRQQKEDTSGDPEVMQFKASQRLLTPNQPASADQQPLVSLNQQQEQLSVGLPQQRGLSLYDRMAAAKDKSAALSVLLESISTTTISTSSDNDSVQEEEKINNVFLPIDAVTNIFGFLTADELENARQVCHTWKNVIDNNRHYLPHRDVNILHLSTNCEFVFALFCDDKVYRYTCQKFWSDFDTEMRENVRIFKGNQEALAHAFPCGKSIMDPSAWTEHYDRSRLHLPGCTVRYTPRQIKTPISSCAFYNIRKRGLYAKQLFTPPLIFYEKLRDMTRFTNIRTLVFSHFSVNETTGDMLKRWVGTICVERVIFHNLNLRGVSPKEFQYLVTESIKAEEYYFEYVHKALPDHFNSDFFMSSTMLLAKTICIGAIFNRNDLKAMVHCNLPEEVLSKFIYRPAPPGFFDTFRFNRDNFNHSEAMLRNARLSIFKVLESKHDPPLPF